ncbi:MAG: hypothetical protein ACK5ZJ_00665 [Acidobacteriota bacterium]
MPDHPPLRPLHARESLNPVKLDVFRKFSAEQLKQSLSPANPEHCLKTRPDGTMLDGHHRIEILHQRGENVNALPREVIERQSGLR